MLLAVGPAARAMYLGAVAKFESWAGRRLARAAPVNDDRLLDSLLADYIDSVFAQELSVTMARNTLHGLIFLHGLPKGKTTLPRARMALSGFLTVQPALSRDPCPWEAAVVLIMWLCSEPHELMSCLAGLAFLLSFDLYLRPSETLALCKTAVVPPVGRMKQWAVIVAPQGSRAPSKNKEYDDTVHASNAGAGRELVGPVLSWLSRACVLSDSSLLQPLTLPVYEMWGHACSKSMLTRDTSHHTTYGTTWRSQCGRICSYFR